MENNQRIEIEGFFIPFTSSEAADIRRVLEENDYTPDGKGLKELVLDMLEDGNVEEGSTERFVRKSKEYLQAHPETVRMGLSVMKGFAEALKRTRT